MRPCVSVGPQSYPTMEIGSFLQQLNTLPLEMNGKSWPDTRALNGIRAENSE